MNLKLLIGSNGERYLAMLSGEILGEFLVNPEITEITLIGKPGLPTMAKIVLEGVKVECIDRIVDSTPRLPAPRTMLPAPAIVDVDYTPEYYDDRPQFHDDECDCWEDEEDTCPDCGQDLCPRCEKCCTPACEAEECDCP